MRIVDYAALVRAVVPLAPLGVAPGTLEATDATPADGDVAIAVSDSRAASVPRAAATHAGVTVRIRGDGRARLVVTASARAARFKYVAARTLPRTHQLVLELWKRTGATVRHGRDDCLTIDSWTTGGGVVTAAGAESGVYEHSFSLRVRDARGNLIGSQRVTAKSGRWRGRVRAPGAPGQRATLEAYDQGARDGAFGTCLAQVVFRVR